MNFFGHAAAGRKDDDPAFVLGAIERGVHRGGARGAAHAGIELLLDGVLATDAAARDVVRLRTFLPTLQLRVEAEAQRLMTGLV